MEWDTWKFWNQPIVYTVTGVVIAGVLALVGIVLTWALGWIGPLFAWLDSFRTAPKLTLTFKDDKAHWNDFSTGAPCVIHRHLRVRVQNNRRTPVENVRAVLTMTERMGNEDFASIHEDSHQLIWSGNEGLKERTVKHGEKAFVDVILCDSRDGQIQLCLFPQNPVTRQYHTVHTLDAGMTEPGDYRFTIEVTSENAPPETIEVRIRWDGRIVTPIFPRRRFFGRP